MPSPKTTSTIGVAAAVGALCFVVGTHLTSTVGDLLRTGIDAATAATVEEPNASAGRDRRGAQWLELSEKQMASVKVEDVYAVVTKLI